MSLLFKHLRIHQIFGANTDVGKTIITTGLVRASAAAHNNVFYLKPVSTGPLYDADDRFVQTYARQEAVKTACLFRYDEPVSPHLAARLSDRPCVPSDVTFVNTIASYIQRSAGVSGSSSAHMYIETAGGVHSPTLSGTTQVEAYRPLFLPTVLIGDAKLGGISTTIAAYEALLLRGYIIDAILLFQDGYYRNAEYLRSYFEEKGIFVGALECPPKRLLDKAENVTETNRYYQKITKSIGEGEINFMDVVNHLDQCHDKRLEELDSMPRRTLDTVWWPFVQHGIVKDENDVNVIDSANSDFFSVYRNPPTDQLTVGNTAATSSSLLHPQFDGSASWWTQTFGHAYTPLTLAASRAAGRYGHVMFPQAAHLPALRLSEALVDGPGKGWAKRAFISDNGSTGMEVAIKMALRAWTRRTGRDWTGGERLGVLGLIGSYHGDTIGAMDACEAAGVYTCEWHDAKGVWLEPPTVKFRGGEVYISLPKAMHPEDGIIEVRADSLSRVYDVERRKGSSLERLYRKHLEDVLQELEEKREKNGGMRLAALVLEPLLMGAGGMKFVDPLFQRVMVDVVRSGKPELGLVPDTRDEEDWKGLPVVFDEVFVGLYRLGMESTGPLLGTNPDIAVNAKVLTGGLLPLAVTLARESVFKAFLGTGKESALLHGHSYSAHAVGCEVALEALKELEKLKTSETWKKAQEKWENETIWSFWDPGFVRAVSGVKNVEEAMTLGCVLAIRVRDETSGYTSHSAQERFSPLREIVGGFGIHYRTLGNVAYFMTSLSTSADVLRTVEDRIWHCL